MGFQKAERSSRPLKILLVGASGTGKTYTSLMLAAAIVQAQSRFCVLDTEANSASLYAGQFDFDVDSDFKSPTTKKLSYDPRIYLAKMDEARQGDYGCIVIDSISDEWEGPGGILSIVDGLTGDNMKLNQNAWRKATPLHDRFFSEIRGSSIPIIATCRAKSKMIYDPSTRKAERGEPEPIQREGSKVYYEFDLAFHLDGEQRLNVTKSRFAALTEMAPDRLTPELADHIVGVMRDV